MKQLEYREGPKVLAEFERTMIALFRAPKKKERKQAKSTSAQTKRKKSDRA